MFSDVIFKFLEPPNSKSISFYSTTGSLEPHRLSYYVSHNIIFQYKKESNFAKFADRTYGRTYEETDF